MSLKYHKALILGVSKTVPLLCFLFLFGLSVTMQGRTYIACQNSVVAATVLILIFIIIQLNKRQIIDRFLLAIALFLVVALVAFIWPVPFLLYCYRRYAPSVFFLCLAIVGTVTMMMSSVSFLGVTTRNKKLLLIGSWQLLLSTFIAFIWSFIMHDQGLMWSVYFPYLGLCLMREHGYKNSMVEALKKEKI